MAARYTESHDDIQGILGTAFAGATTFTPAEYRTSNIVLNEVGTGDVFSMIFQMPHRKKLGTACDSVHLHYIPLVANDGDIAFTYTWGWYNTGDVIPATLPNTGTVADITLASADQYKLKINSLITNLAAPTSETYSSILMVTFTAVAPADGTNWWTTGNKIAIVYMDAHFVVDRLGSVNEATD